MKPKQFCYLIRWETFEKALQRFRVLVQYGFYALIVTGITSCTVKNHKDPELIKSARVLDSLKKKFEIGDSIKLIYNDTSSFTIFIDYNKKSEYHRDQKKRFNYWLFDSTYYDEQISEQKKLIQNPGRSFIPDSLKSRLVPVYSIDSKFYVYYDCDFQPVFEINDSTFNWYTMEPVTPYLIDSLVFSEKGFEFKNPVNKKIVFNRISNNPVIYKLSIDESCFLVTPIRNFNHFPILVVFCSIAGLSPIMGEVKFDDIKCN